MTVSYTHLESLEIAAVRLGIKYEIHYTRGTKDGEIYVRNLCRKYSGTDEKLRIYALSLIHISKRKAKRTALI